MSHRTAEFYFASDPAFLQRVTEAIADYAQTVMAEANNVSNPNRTIKRQALASRVLLDGQGQFPPLFARAIGGRTGGAVRAAVDFAYDGHAPQDPEHPTAAETALINKTANSGVTDAQLDADVLAEWNAMADVLATD